MKPNDFLKFYNFINKDEIKVSVDGALRII